MMFAVGQIVEVEGVWFRVEKAKRRRLVLRRIGDAEIRELTERGREIHEQVSRKTLDEQQPTG